MPHQHCENTEWRNNHVLMFCVKSITGDNHRFSVMASSIPSTLDPLQPDRPDRRMSTSQSNSSDRLESQPLLCNTLKYTVTAKEYRYLYRFVISRNSAIKKKAPSPAHYEAFLYKTNGGAGGTNAASSGSGYNAAAVRDSMRLFLILAVGMKTWDTLSKRLFGKGRPSAR